VLRPVAFRFVSLRLVVSRCLFEPFGFLGCYEYCHGVLLESCSSSALMLIPVITVIWGYGTPATSTHSKLKTLLRQNRFDYLTSLFHFNLNRSKLKYDTITAGCNIKFYARISMFEFFEKLKNTRSRSPF
jgi:hypothetical protein